MFLLNLELGVCNYTLATQFVGYFGWKYGPENVCCARKAELVTKIFYVADEVCRMYHHILTVQESVSQSVFIPATDVYTPTCGSIQPWSLMSQAAAISPFDGFSFSPWWDRVRGKELVLWAVVKSGNVGCTPQIFLKDSNLCAGLLYKSAKWFSY